MRSLRLVQSRRRTWADTVKLICSALELVTVDDKKLLVPCLISLKVLKVSDHNQEGTYSYYSFRHTRLS